MNCVRLCTVRHPTRGEAGARPAWGPSPKLRVYTQSGRVFHLRILPRVLQKALCSSLAAPALDRATDALRARLARRRRESSSRFSIIARAAARLSAVARGNSHGLSVIIRPAPISPPQRFCLRERTCIGSGTSPACLDARCVQRGRPTAHQPCCALGQELEQPLAILPSQSVLLDSPILICLHWKRCGQLTFASIFF